MSESPRVHRTTSDPADARWGAFLVRRYRSTSSRESVLYDELSGNVVVGIVPVSVEERRRRRRAERA